MKRANKEHAVSLWGLLAALFLAGLVAAVFLIPNHQAWNLYDLDRAIAEQSLGSKKMTSLETETGDLYYSVQKFVAKEFIGQDGHAKHTADPLSQKLAPFTENATSNLAFALWYFIEHGLAACLWWPLGVVLFLTATGYGLLSRSIRQWDHPASMPSKWPAALLKLSGFLLACALIAPLGLSLWLVPTGLTMASVGLAKFLRQVH